jgi:hypothetical protein
MDSLYCTLEGRSFLALLNGLAKILFYEDNSVTYETLTEQLYAGTDLEAAEIKAQIESYEKVYCNTIFI